MITFGYKTKMSSLLRACAAIGIGLVMVLGSDATKTVVRIVASFLFASGLVSFFYGLKKKDKDGSFLLMAVNAAVDVILGLLLFLKPEWVAGGIIIFIGALLLLFGVLQLVVLATVRSFLGARSSLLILPAVAVIGGIFLVFNPFGVKVMTIAAGAFLIIYGCSEVFSTWKVSKAKKEYEIRNPDDITTPEASISEPGPVIEDAKEVEFTKVDD
ncbi:MAG: DUF308 domain-containing protein [Bacteroidales bacterium]|nr:DUF308 domain-containing protein [Bacteroidales bacterium]